MSSVQYVLKILTGLLWIFQHIGWCMLSMNSRKIIFLGDSGVKPCQ